MNAFQSAIAANIRAVIGGVLFGSALISTNGFAVAPARAGVTAPTAQRAAAVPLETFVGFYQAPDKASFVQFELKGDVLFAQWQNKEYQLVRVDDTHFKTKGEGHEVEFRKDGSGRFTQAMLLGNILTVKVGFDPYTVKPLSAAQLKGFEGTYRLTGDSSFEIAIRSSADGLTLKQLWDNKEIAFTPRSDTFFLNADGTFPMTFLLRDGEAVQVTCFKADVWRKTE